MTPIEFIKENNLEWQPSFSRSINSTLFGYRGALIIQEGKKLSETKVMPPKAQARQVIMISENEKIKFFACELETFGYFEQFFEKYKETNRVFLLPDNLNATEYKGYIARMRFFIGARTHATIAAYSTGVPTMVLGYSVKSKGIAKDIFGEEKLVLGIDEISDAGKLIAKFEEMKNEEDSIKEILKNKIPKIKEMSQKAKTYLAEALL